MHDHRKRYWLWFGDAYRCCCLGSNRLCYGEETVKAAEDKGTVAQMVAAAAVVETEGRKKRWRWRIVLVDTSLA